MPGSLLTEPLDSAKTASPVTSTVSSSCSHVISSHPTPRLLLSSGFYSDASSLALSSISNY